MSGSAHLAARLGIVKFAPEGELFPGRNGAPGVSAIVDVRGALADLALRDLIIAELIAVLTHDFPGAEVLAGLAKAGVPWAAIVADRQRLPAAVINTDGPRASGLRRQIEGDVAGRSVVLVDNLIAQGGALTRAAELAATHGARVMGAITIVADPGVPLAFPVRAIWRQRDLIEAALEVGRIDGANHRKLNEEEKI